MSEKIITETTMKRIAESLKKQRIALDAISKGWKIGDWGTVQNIVESGLAQKYFQIGDQFFIDYKNGQDDYPNIPLDVMNFCQVFDADGNKHPGMALAFHYTMPFAIQFDASENTPTTDETFQAGYYYYLLQDDGSYAKQEVEVGTPIPKEKTYVRNELNNAEEVISYGYNRWSHSAYRQWLNSDKPRGEWWKPQHDGDTPPQELSIYDGFMKGLPADFLAVVKPIKVQTYKNTVTDDGELETTIDRFFLPSVEEMYGKLQINSNPELVGEGEAWQYWKEATGFDTASNGITDRRYIQALNGESRNDNIYLRSSVSISPYLVWVLRNWDGQLAGPSGGKSARMALYASPACVIY